MTLSNFSEKIESVDFQSQFMIFSGFKLVRKALSKDKTIASLINEARLNPSYIDNIGKRILRLSEEHKDRPGATFDVAVAAYLYCLYKTDQYFAKRMSEYVLQMGKLWWSVDLALHIKKNMELFAEPGMRKFNYSGYTAAIEDISWSPSVVQKPTYQEILVGFNGEEPCNISGQFSVKSPHKTSRLMYSVS